jgi:hypothetical protein
MSADAIREIRRLLKEREIDAAEARDRLSDLSADTSKDELWTQFAEQGLYDEAIRQDGYVSFRGNTVQRRGEDG